MGTVVARHAEGYRVDIGAAHMASLDALAFEGATKRNRPNLKVITPFFSLVVLGMRVDPRLFLCQVGALVYARVSLANRDMEPELECFDATTRKSEGFEELKGGTVFPCSLGMARRSASFPLLSTVPSVQR